MFRTLSKRILVVKKQKKFRTLLHVRKFENDDYRERYKIQLCNTILVLDTYSSISDKLYAFVIFVKQL